MPLHEIAFRLLAALVAGFLFGIEREMHGRAAGLRTMILVCVASALAALLSDSYYRDAAESTGWRPDPLRLGAGLFAGIGFLGAGTIIRQGSVVRGVTTAAILWYATMIGLCFGSGSYLLGTAGTLAGLPAIYLLPSIERRLRYDQYARLDLTYSNRVCSTEPFVHLLKEREIEVRRISLQTHVESGECEARFQLRFRHRNGTRIADEIVPHIAGLPGVRRVEWSSQA